MQSVDRQPHLQLCKEDITPVAVVMGDPRRAKDLAEMCDSHKELQFSREYRSFACTHDGESFTVVSHGIGCPGALICFEELIHLGVKVLIRAGTCGSLQPQKHRQGDIAISHVAAIEEGASKLLAPNGFPAAADPYVYAVLNETALDAGANPKHGIVLCTDLFYLPSGSESSLQSWHKSGVAFIEMESSVMFVIAALKNIKAGFIGVVDGSPLHWDEGFYAPTGDIVMEAKAKMNRIALAAAVRITKEKNY